VSLGQARAGVRQPPQAHEPSSLRLALSVGLVGGFVLGCREGIISLQANAAVQPDQHLFGYLADPILAWMVLASLLLMLCATVLAVLRRAGQVAIDPHGVGEHHPWLITGLAPLPIYVTALTACGLPSAIVPALLSAADQAWAVGTGVGFGLHLLSGQHETTGPHTAARWPAWMPRSGACSTRSTRPASLSARSWSL
jgi:hypothetical protein